MPQGNATPLGRYLTPADLTPADAHAALTADPSILFVDVRDPIEVSFVATPTGSTPTCRWRP